MQRWAVRQYRRKVRQHVTDELPFFCRSDDWRKHCNSQKHWRNKRRRKRFSAVTRIVTKQEQDDTLQDVTTYKITLCYTHVNSFFTDGLAMTELRMATDGQGRPEIMTDWRWRTGEWRPAKFTYAPTTGSMYIDIVNV